jgi:hypothetical protein
VITVRAKPQAVGGRAATVIVSSSAGTQSAALIATGK